MATKRRVHREEIVEDSRTPSSSPKKSHSQVKKRAASCLTNYWENLGSSCMISKLIAVIGAVMIFSAVHCLGLMPKYIRPVLVQPFLGFLRIGNMSATALTFGSLAYYMVLAFVCCCKCSCNCGCSSNCQCGCKSKKGESCASCPCPTPTQTSVINALIMLSVSTFAAMFAKLKEAVIFESVLMFCISRILAVVCCACKCDFGKVMFRTLGLLACLSLLYGAMMAF